MAMDTVHKEVENGPEMEASQIITLLQLNLFKSPQPPTAKEQDSTHEPVGNFSVSNNIRHRGASALDKAFFI